MPCISATTTDLPDIVIHSLTWAARVRARARTHSRMCTRVWKNPSMRRRQEDVSDGKQDKEEDYKETKKGNHRERSVTVSFEATKRI